LTGPPSPPPAHRLRRDGAGAHKQERQRALKKLLEGCKLLSDSCPETNVPLVSTADGRMYSVGNGAYYMRHGNEIVKVADTPAVPASPAKVESPTRGFITAHVHAPPGSVVPPSGGRTPSGAALAAGADGQSLSSRVAAKLLEGYTLLSESCPSTSVPLVQDQSGHILSVGTGRWYERTGGQLTEVGPPSAPVPGLAASTPIAAAPAPAFPRTSASFQQNGTPLAPPPPFFPPSPASHNGYSNCAPHSATNAVASALLSTATSEAPPANYARPSPAAPFAYAPSPAYGRQASAASTKVAAQEAAAVLGGRLSEATSALVDAPIREAAAHVALIKDIALAISALKQI